MRCRRLGAALTWRAPRGRQSAAARPFGPCPAVAALHPSVRCPALPRTLPPAPGQPSRPAPQFHRTNTQDYPLQRPALFLHQLLNAATHLAVSVTADPPPEPAEGAEEEDEQALAAKHR